MSERRYSEITLHRRLLPMRARLASPGGLFGLSFLSAPLALLMPLPLRIAVDHVVGPYALPGAIDRYLPAAPTGRGSEPWFWRSGSCGVAVLRQLLDLANLILSALCREQLVLEIPRPAVRHVQRLSLALPRHPRDRRLDRTASSTTYRVRSRRHGGLIPS